MKTRWTVRSLALAAALLGTAATAQAGEVYGSLGIPGVMLGYAQPINDMFGVRADFATLGTRTKQFTEEGVTYDGKLNTNRVALLGDWYPFSGVFRFTGGLTFNNYKLVLDTTATGQTVTIGDTPYTLTAADGMKVTVEFPRTTPYVGFGWGHQSSSGWRGAFDIGAMIGKAKVTAETRGALSQQAAQADVDKELAQLRDGVGKVRAIPQITLSVGYSF